MKLMTTAIVSLFAVAAFANQPHAAKADKKAEKPAAAATAEAHADKACEGKTGKDLETCKAEAAKTHKK